MSKKRYKVLPHRLENDVQGSLEDIKRALAMARDLEENYSHIWDRGEDFLEDVRDKLVEVRDTIKQAGEVSLRQATAIENWCRGIRRWHPEHKHDD